MRKGRRVEEIAEAFAEAVARGDFRAAEGWMAVARFVESTEPVPSEAREREPRAVDRRRPRS